MTRVEQAIRRKGGPLLGACAHTYHPAFVEMAGMVGFDMIWIEMEHLPISVAQAADLCRIAAGVGMLTMLRVPDARRDSVLKAAECGPDIILLPMANSADTVRELVAHARYGPEGNRGYFTSSRAMRYGLGDIVEEQRRVNEELCLLVQIETKAAVESLKEITGVSGVSGVFIGPGDLSASMGFVGHSEHPTVQETIETVLAAAKGDGLVTALPAASREAGRWARAGVDMLFCGGEISLLKAGLQSCLGEAREALEREGAR